MSDATKLRLITNYTTRLTDLYGDAKNPFNWGTETYYNDKRAAPLCWAYKHRDSDFQGTPLSPKFADLLQPLNDYFKQVNFNNLEFFRRRENLFFYIYQKGRKTIPNALKNRFDSQKLKVSAVDVQWGHKCEKGALEIAPKYKVEQALLVLTVMSLWLAYRYADRKNRFEEGQVMLHEIADKIKWCSNNVPRILTVLEKGDKVKRQKCFDDLMTVFNDFKPKCKYDNVLKHRNASFGNFYVIIENLCKGDLRKSFYALDELSYPDELYTRPHVDLRMGLNCYFENRDYSVNKCYEYMIRIIKTIESAEIQKSFN